MHDIGIRSLLAMLRRRIAWVILFPLLATLAAGVFSVYCIDDIYTARASLYVLIRYPSADGGDRFDIATGTGFSTDFGTLFERSPVAPKTAVALRVPDLVEQVMLSAELVTGTRVIDIYASGKDAFLCAAACNTASRLFCSYIESFMDVESVSVTQEADVPEKPTSPDRVRIILLVFLVSAAFVLCGAIGAGLMDERMWYGQRLDMPELPAIYPVFSGRRTVYRCRVAGEQGVYRLASRSTQESLRALAASIAARARAMDLRTIILADILPEDGKIALAHMVAEVLAADGGSVLLLDAIGAVTEVDEEDESLAKASWLDSIRYATLLGGGAGGIAAVLPQYLEATGQHYDYVLVVAPPAALCIDAALMAAGDGSGLLLTARDGKVKRQYLQLAMGYCRQVNARVLGIAFTVVAGRFICDKMYEASGKAYAKRTKKQDL